MISASSNGAIIVWQILWVVCISEPSQIPRKKVILLPQEKKKRIIDLLGQRRKLTTVPLALGPLVILKIVIGLQSGLA